MPLLVLWSSNPKAISEASVEQIVAIAGDGNLRDTSSCSTELREYFSQTDSEKLSIYVEQCLTAGFNKSGFVLQDLVNELGRRLDYTVANGRYQGTATNIGSDGIWTSPEGRSIVVEVKTTDAYRIPLDTLAGYRQKHLAAKTFSEPSSILIVVGRQDTGELEAQIRGSRHAWDIRVISTDALLKLVQLKENSESTETGRQIRSLLTPMEYRRLDNMIDVMFTTATDVETVIAQAVAEPNKDEEGSPAVEEKSGWDFTDSAILDAKRAEIIDAVSRKIGAKLIKKSRALFWDAAHEKRVACSISKRYTKGSYPYWYAFHPEWLDFLRESPESYFVLGCMDLETAFSIPLKVISENLDGLNTTTTSKKTYWHVHLIEGEIGSYALLLPHFERQLSLDEFRISVAPE
jgi:hypothetical protein